MTINGKSDGKTLSAHRQIPPKQTFKYRSGKIIIIAPINVKPAQSAAFLNFLTVIIIIVGGEI